MHKSVNFCCSIQFTLALITTDGMWAKTNTTPFLCLKQHILFSWTVERVGRYIAWKLVYKPGESGFWDGPIKSQHVRVNIDEHTHTHTPIHLSDTFLLLFLFFFFWGGGVLMVYYITVKVVVPARYDFPSVLTKQNSHSRVHTGADGRDGSYLHVHTVKCVVCLHQIRELHLLIHFEILCWTGWLSCKLAKAWIRTFWNECDTQKALVAVVEYNNNNLKTKILNHCQE